MLRDDTLELFCYVCKKPKMYVQSARFETVCAFVDGFNMALQGAPLMGFREWLLTGNVEWTNLPWWALVRQRVNASANLSESPSSEEDAELLVGLADALAAFSAACKEGGVARIFLDYSQWLLSRSDSATESLRERLRSPRPG